MENPQDELNQDYWLYLILKYGGISLLSFGGYYKISCFLDSEH